MKISDADTSPHPSFDDVSIPSDSPSEDIDDTEMGDFLCDALSDDALSAFHPIESEHDAYLESLCEV